ncbi:PREDICTED: dmX-like protein 2, partial [Priapulus caudatus]|uniref:DmX-like protein 2 n=1 Tax=Priapulus caudatus TaxID=37621 RepID=A0ABM1EQ44_PRICU
MCFCSELILWKVDTVGPLSKSGGIKELARLNSPEISAFSNVAWVPTLLPSTSLGSMSNSSSAVFVVSDGTTLRLYQAVIDARSMLQEIQKQTQRRRYHSAASAASYASASSGEERKHSLLLDNPYHIASQQSAVRPGCLIQLDSISDAKRSHDVTSPYPGTKVFNYYVPDTNIMQEDDAVSNPSSSRGSSPTGLRPGSPPLTFPRSTTPTAQMSSAKLSITTTKVCSQKLHLPRNVEVLDATAAAGHLSSSSIYPACFAPYLVTIACSDGTVRFLKCEMGFTAGDDVAAATAEQPSFEWKEWDMMTSTSASSEIYLAGQPLAVRCAYSGRIACAFKMNETTIPGPLSDDGVGHTRKTVDVAVAIYECESTGGAEWVLEDTIELRRVRIPAAADVRHDVDLNFLSRSKQMSMVRSVENFERLFQSHVADYEKDNLHEFIHKTLTRRLSVPSMATLHNIRKAVFAIKDQGLLQQKCCVQLDWVSTEDGSHILCVGVGNEINLYAPVSSEIATANMRAMQEKNVSVQQKPRPMLQRSSSVAAQNYTSVDVIHWMRLHTIGLTTADGLPPLPMAMSFVRDGLLVVGMDNEMQVFSQWKPEDQTQASLEMETHKLDDHVDIKSVTTTSFQSAMSSRTNSVLKLSSMVGSSSGSSGGDARRKKRCGDYSDLFEFGDDGGGGGEDDDTFLVGSPGRVRMKSGSTPVHPNYFGPFQVQLLTKYLTHTLLPGLTSLDQMHLLAMADTVASTDADRYGTTQTADKKSAESYSGMGLGGGGGGYAAVTAVSTGTDTIDDCGLRFLLAMRQYTYLQRSLPPVHRAQLQQMGLSTAMFAWALHSEAQ